jgi:hypothetical protein
MKKLSIILLMLAVACVAMLSSCKKEKTATVSAVSTESTEQPEVDEDCLFAINYMLANEIGATYAPGEYSIPFETIVAIEDGDEGDIWVWGDFWIFNYNRNGDVLETVSGGNHPGKIRLDIAEYGYELREFEQVADGADFEASAKAIFGKYYDAYQAVASDQDAREEIRRAAIEEFVKEQNLSVTQYKDYGWPARPIAK